MFVCLANFFKLDSTLECLWLKQALPSPSSLMIDTKLPILAFCSLTFTFILVCQKCFDRCMPFPWILLPVRDQLLSEHHYFICNLFFLVSHFKLTSLSVLAYR